MGSFPAYPKRPHKTSQARIKIGGHDIWLGRHGSQESRQRYAELACQFAAGTITPTSKPAGSSSTVSEVADRFNAEVKRVKSDKEVWHYDRALKALSRLYGSEPAASFDDLKLERLRDAMLTATWLNDEERHHPKASGGWSQRVTNRAVQKIRECWAWAERHRLVPNGSYGRLLLLRSLKKTDRHVRSTKPRKGIDQPALEAILPDLPAVVQGIAETQWWSGLRPCETIRMRVCDIEQLEADCWLYHLSSKNSWREGRESEAAVLGPEAIRVLRPWFEAARLRGEDAWIFPAVRKGQCYTTGGYAQAVAAAFAHKPKLQKWTPYQLRHGAKRRITRAHGLDAARAFLRHSSISTTAGYDRERDLTIAMQAARQSG